MCFNVIYREWQSSRLTWRTIMGCIFIYLVFTEEGAWSMELDNTCCDTEYYWSGSIASQLGFQDMCLKNPACVGISYSYMAGMINTCFVCKTVFLSDFNRNRFGFSCYTAPGKVCIFTKNQICITMLNF